MLTTDWHLHTRNSCDCRDGALPTTMAATVAAIEAHGMRHYGITDHLHTPYNLPDLEASRREFLALPPSPHRHFGVEVSCVSQWELDEVARGAVAHPVYGIRSGGPAGGAVGIGLTADDIARLGIEYVVGGTHWPLYVPLEREAVIRDYHRQNLFLACHPLVTIVAHPWWWMGHWQETDGVYRTAPWFDDFASIPQTLHDEFLAAVREHGKVVEINLCAMLLTPHYPEAFKRQYCDYLASLQAAGVPLSLGSDHHAQHHQYGEINLAFAEGMLAAVGIDAGALWQLPAQRSH
jgi:histidinol phosphatase-like PHP family hydrolase